MKKRFLSFQRVCRRSLIAMTWAAVVLHPAAVFAQEDIAPPVPAIRNAPAVWWGYAILFILLGIVMTVSLMPSKRSHQD